MAQNRLFAQIHENKVYCVFEAPSRPPMAHYIELVDVTDVRPRPQPGWLYLDGRFSPPPAGGPPKGIYVHGQILDKDNSEPPRVLGDGQDSLTVGLIVSGCDYCEYSPLPVNGSVLLQVGDGEKVLDAVKAAVENGIAEFTYTTTLPPGRYHFAVADLQLEGTDTSRYYADVLEFLVYRKVE